MIKLLFERDGDCDCVIFCLFPMSTLCHFLTDSFYTVRTVSILSKRCQYFLNSFCTVWIVSILSTWFQYCPEGFNIFQTVPVLPDCFNTVENVSNCLNGFKLFGNWPIWGNVISCQLERAIRRKRSTRAARKVIDPPWTKQFGKSGKKARVGRDRRICN